MITSLINNKLVINESVSKRLDAAKEGASPDFVVSRKRSKIPPTNSRPSLQLRRCTSNVENGTTSPDHLIPANLDSTSPVSRTCSKRPGSLSTDVELKSMAKRRSTGDQLTRPFMKSSQSLDSIPRFCSLTGKPSLTADASRQLLLPTVLSATKNRSLNNVDCHAVADLLNGRYSEQVSLFYKNYHIS